VNSRDDKPVESAGNNEIESEKLGKRLLETMKEVDELVLEINNNNHQVKVLAVNASIRAGLAGAEGEGFSIIANEVAALAKKSLSFVENVNHATENLGDSVMASVALRLVDATRDTMSKIDRNLFERFCDVQAWATFPQLIEAVAGSKFGDTVSTGLLQSIHKIYEVYHDIYLLGGNGQLLAAAVNQSIIGQDFALKDWFKAAISGKIHVSDIYSSGTLQMPLMSFAAPVMDENKRVIGVMASRFNCQFLNDIIKTAIVSSGSEVYLLNHKGLVIGSKNPGLILTKDLSKLLAKKEQDQDFGAFDEVSEVNQKDLFSVGYAASKGYNTYKGQKWTLVARSPKTTAALREKLSPAELFQRVRSGKHRTADALSEVGR
jgi:hypothetical protein